MVFTVTYRLPDGHLTDTVIEAENRGDCIAKCKEKGISPVRLTVGSKPTAKANGISTKWVFIGIGALIVIISCYLLLTMKRESPAPNPPAEKKVVIKKATEPIVVKPVVAETPKSEKKLPKWKYPVDRTNELNAVELRKWRAMHRPPPGYTNTTSLTEAPPKYAIFKHRSENEIAALLTMTPGETLVGTPHYTKRFTEDFLKSLETPIIVSEEDSEEDAELKRAMVQTKIELKARIDAGEDLGQILLDTRREYQDLARYKMMLQGEINEIKKNPDATIQDVEDFVTAANSLLEQKGIAPIKLSPISKRMLLRKKGIK